MSGDRVVGDVTQAEIDERKSRQVITSEQFVMKWADALGIEIAKCNRVVIDCKAGDAMRIYVSYFGTDALLDVEPPEPEAVKITIAGDPA